jgi:hypothetical protein
VFEDNMLRMFGLYNDRRPEILLEEELCNFHSSLNMIGVTKYYEINRTGSTHGAVKIANILVGGD